MPNSQNLTQRIRRLFREWHCSGILAAVTLTATLSSSSAIALMQIEVQNTEVTVADIRI